MTHISILPNSWGVDMRVTPSLWGRELEWIDRRLLVLCLALVTVFVNGLGINFRKMGIGDGTVFGGSSVVQIMGGTARLTVRHLPSIVGAKRRGGERGMRDTTK